MKFIASASRVARRRSVFALVAAALVVGWSLAACGPAASAEPAAPTDIRAALRVVAERADVDNEYFALTPLYQARKEVAEWASAAADKKIQALLQAGFQELRAGVASEGVARIAEARNVLPQLTKPEELAKIKSKTLLSLGVANLRVGELDNCCARHTPESCVMPIRGGGLHTKPEGSLGAIAAFMEALQVAKPGSEDFWTAKWLLNIAHMTIGSWPEGVPLEHRLQPTALGSPTGFPRFPNVATFSGFGGMNLAGGVAVEDFDGDGAFDVVVSSWDCRKRLRYYKDAGDGTFAEVGVERGFEGLLGGLNVMPVDFDGDGDQDLFVPRGAWMANNGKHPNSLLRNDDGVFTDVSYAMGLAGGKLDSPTQAAAWADFDMDGDLDLYVGNESQPRAGIIFPSQLFRNDRTKFTEIAAKAGVTNDRWAKGVAWGDYDGDGDPDLYVSNLSGDNRLYRNEGDGTFKDVAPALGVVKPFDGFPCWFYDANQDGRLDIYAAAFFRSAAPMAAAYFGKPDPEQYCRLYLNDGKGGFKDATEAWGMTRVAPAMGANFGDLENDGYPDVYLATGAPNYDTLTPNIMYANKGGAGYRDVTVAGGFGVLQKGHGVAFADLDGDGDQDVFAQTGGAYEKDTFHNAVFRNPGFGNRWLRIRLAGKKANRAAYGARIRADVIEDGKERSVYSYVGCVASFGSNPVAATLGLGKATKIKRLEVRWPKPSGLVQEFSDLSLDSAYEIVEGATAPEAVEVKKIAMRTD